MKQVLVIINPRSGKEQIKGRLLEILNLFAANGYLSQVYITQKRGDGMHAAKNLGGKFDLVVCSGGDGTLNEVVSGLMELEARPDLGYIPAGSTNDYAASLQMNKNMIKAAGDILNGSPYPIDVGRFNSSRYFVYIAGFGAFTEVSYMTPQESKNMLGHQAYLLEVVKSLAALHPHKLRIETENGVACEGEFLFGMVTNTISVGGFKGLVAQDVALNDGMFEVMMIRMPKTPKDLSSILSYVFLKEEDNGFVYKFKASYLRIQSQQPVDWVLDGEFGGTHQEVEIQNLQKQIRILRKKEEMC